MCMHVYLYAFTLVLIHAEVYLNTFTCTQTWVFPLMRFICVGVHVHSNVCACVYVWEYVSVYECEHVNIHVGVSA